MWRQQIQYKIQGIVAEDGNDYFLPFFIQQKKVDITSAEETLHPATNAVGAKETNSFETEHENYSPCHTLVYQQARAKYFQQRRMQSPLWMGQICCDSPGGCLITQYNYFSEPHHFQVQKRKNRQLTLGGLRFAKSLLIKELRSCKAIKHVIYNCRHF